MKKIVATVFNSPYYLSGLGLIASIHRNSYDSVDEIIVYDLGLTNRELELLNKCAKVKIIGFPDAVKGYYDGYLEPRQHAYKLWVVKDAGNYGELIFFLDAGIAVLHDLQPVFAQIEKEEIFLVQDIHLNIDWTHQRALELMNASEKEKYGKQLSSGILGYKQNGKYRTLIDEAFVYSQNKEIVHGNHENHRHDQSIYSILAIRYNCPVQSIEIYGEWRGILNASQALYVHRRKYLNHEGLRYK
jgi:hypothetical protein